MKKILSLAMAIAMLCLAAVPAFAADDEMPANCYSKQYVVLTDKAPTIDGNITAEEWGDAEFLLNQDITEGKRTYCKDTFGGKGLLIPDWTFQWAYDNSNFYLAMTVINPTYAADDYTVTSVDETMTLQLGDFELTMDVADGSISGEVPDDVDAALTVDGSTKYYEFAIPRSAIGENDTFAGYIEHKATVNTEELSYGCGIRSRNTPVFSEDTKTHDLFVLTTAEKMDEVKAEDTTKAEETTKAAEQTEAPATFDAFVIAAVVASAAAAGIVVSKKRR